ncbi:MAG: hypothetical protein ACJA2S_000993 [Cyclobacteriaceae bacterium]|jgi:hypothetical protein
MSRFLIFLSVVFFLSSCACENREVNPETGPDFSEIHENMEYHFDKIKIDGNEYFILERDRNNPHEGFGFMALNGSAFSKNQDSIKAYLKTVLDVQSEILAKLNNQSKESVRNDIENMLNSNLSIINATKTSETEIKKAKD